MVESTALEMRRTGNRTVGSNPTLSASLSSCRHWRSGESPDSGGRLVRVVGDSIRVAASRPNSGRGQGTFLPPIQHFANPVGNPINTAIKQVLILLVRLQRMSCSGTISQITDKSVKSIVNATKRHAWNVRARPSPVDRICYQLTIIILSSLTNLYLCHRSEKIRAVLLLFPRSLPKPLSSVLCLRTRDTDSPSLTHSVQRNRCSESKSRNKKDRSGKLVRRRQG